MNRLYEIARETMSQYQMLSNTNFILVGLSGGADSMALTHFLWELAHEKGFALEAAHINHGLRGGESDEDELFVQQWCEQRGIPLHRMRVDLPREAAKRGIGLEECGREIRYDYFQRFLPPQGGRIATAHTLSDSVETFFLHLLQGAGMRGLSGIPPVRGDIIRPLIEVSREQVEIYCKEKRLSYRTDTSNFSRAYTRNQIRLDIIPKLKKKNPSLERTLLRTMRTASADEEYLSTQAELALNRAKSDKGYQVALLRDLPLPLLSRAVRLLAEREGAKRLEGVHIEQMCRLLKEGDGGISLPGYITLHIRNGYFQKIYTKKEEKEWMVPLLPPRSICENSRTIQIFHISKKEYEDRRKFNKKLFNNAMDYATITGSILLRNRLPGDRFCQAGRGVTKSLKKLFNEEKIPQAKREQLFLAADGSRVLWLEGFGAAQCCAVTDSTESVLLILPEECGE